MSTEILKSSMFQRFAAERPVAVVVVRMANFCGLSLVVLSHLFTFEIWEGFLSQLDVPFICIISE